MTASLDFETLRNAVAGSAAAFRSSVELQPAGGPGDKVFPPTYEGSRYATEQRRLPGDDELVDCVLLDSVQSQANRMEEALLEAWREGRIPLPVVTVDFSGADLERELRITSLEAPHRIADALLRDSLLEGKPFRKSEVGRRIDAAVPRNATPLFELCPTALVFGMWDSTGPKGGLGAKFQRAIVSEIVGIGAEIGTRTSSRIDPAGIQRNAGPLYKASDGAGIGWTLDASEAERIGKKDEPVLYDLGRGAEGKSGNPAKANHGNVTPTISDGGVTLRYALHTTVLSLTALRRLRFPLNDGSDGGDLAARTALAALGLCAAALSRERGYDLRSRCQLFPSAPLRWQLLDRPGEEPSEYELTGERAVEIYAQAVAEARRAGMPWLEDELVLRASEPLAALVRRSQQLTAQAADEEE